MTHRLEYPYTAPPQPGSAIALSPQIKWVRMPLPFKLDHINLYLIRDDSSWVVVDTGLADMPTRDYWQQLFSTQLEGLPISGVIVTHCHPDHAGQAGWITTQFQAPLWMSQAEYLHARLFDADPAQRLSPASREFLHRAGLDLQQLTRIDTQLDHSSWHSDPIPGTFRRLVDGQSLTIGGQRWQVMTGYGHSPEHVCLYCPDLGVLLSGDQVLPEITSNISVHAHEPDANPLDAWLQALQRLSRLPAKTLVLPAHNLPFRGLHSRLAALNQHQQSHMTALLQRCGKPHTVLELVQQSYRRQLQATELLMALGECMARLNSLIEGGLLQRSTGHDGVHRYHAATVHHNTTQPAALAM